MGTVFVGTGCEPDEPEEAAQEVDLVYVEWACAIATTNLLAEVLESEMGYEVNMTSAEAGMAYSDLAAGGTDAFAAAWLPVTHESYYNEYEGEFNNLGPVYEGARIGLVVPEYIDIDNIEEMDEIGDDLGWQITGIDPGAGIMQATEEALEVYDSLEDYDLLDSSDVGMTAELDASVDNEEPIVVTGWTPHWKFAEYDLKFLDDPENVYGDAETINALTRLGLDEDLPEVYEFLENFHVTDDELGEVMAMIEDTGDERGSAAEWVEENQDVVEGWLP